VARTIFVSQMSHSQKQKILLVLLGLLPEALLDYSLIPLYPFMVRHLMPNEPESSIGFYSGLLASAFYMPLFIMNVVWGAASDRLGRKPILLAGMLVCLATTMVTGYTNNYTIVLACRFLAGIFGANSTVAKGMIGALDQESRAWYCLIKPGGFLSMGVFILLAALQGQYWVGCWLILQLIYPGYLDLINSCNSIHML
jgi:MFS family permease